MPTWPSVRWRCSLSAGILGSRLPVTMPNSRNPIDTARCFARIRRRLRASVHWQPVAVGQRDPVVTLYRTLLVCAAVAIVILAAGLAEFFYFEPFAQSSGLHARITGVYAYDPV